MNINRLGSRIAAMVVALLAAAIGTVSYFALARSADSLETASDMYGREAVLRRMDWPSIGDSEAGRIADVALGNLRSMIAARREGGL